MKKRLSSETAYVLGMLILPLGAAFMEAAGFGLSMVVAPAYLLHLKISRTLPFFTFGMAEYTFQALLLVALVITVKKFRPYFLFSFVTAVLYGLLLDGWMKAVALIPAFGLVSRTAYFLLGIAFCAVGVAFFFKTYVAPAVYELFVKELAEKTGAPDHRVKTVYDCASCVLAIVMSFAFFGFGRFEGVKWGTVLCALVNGWLIGKCSDAIDRVWEIYDRFPLRRFFR